MFLINPRDNSGNLKSSDQLAQEATKAYHKYRKVESQVRFKMTLASISGKIKVVLQNNFLTKYLERRKHRAFANRIAKRAGENLRRNIEAEKTDPNYKAPI